MAYFNDPGKAKEQDFSATDDEKTTLLINHLLAPMVRNVGTFQLTRPKMYPIHDGIARQRINKFLNEISEMPFQKDIFLGRASQYFKEHYVKDIFDALPYPVLHKRFDTSKNVGLNIVINKLLQFAKKQKFSDEQTSAMIYNFIDKFFQNQFTTLSEHLEKAFAEQ